MILSSLIATPYQKMTTKKINNLIRQTVTKNIHKIRSRFLIFCLMHLYGKKAVDGHLAGFLTKESKKDHPGYDSCQNALEIAGNGKLNAN